MQKSLDLAIMQQEITDIPDLCSGYRIGEMVYKNYLSNESWTSFKADMEAHHQDVFLQYTLGGGKELEERKVGKHIYPPKMASFGSSSRMIYNLMKCNSAFLYEKKLPTMVGGTANIDGFIETDEKCVFVEAKCREPYGTKNNEVADKYKLLYEFLTQSTNNNLICEISHAQKGKMKVHFFVEQKALQHFDIKQMICHLLGVASAYLQGEYDKKIDFIYLLYNPTQLQIVNEAHQKEIMCIYNRECQECQSVDFAGLFYDVLVFLKENYKIGAHRNIRRISQLFSFRMCDQYTMHL